MQSFYSMRTVRWHKGTVMLLDQSRLPDRLSFVRCKNHREVAESIRNMVVRGAPAIGVAAAMGLALAAIQSQGATKEQLMGDLSAAARTIRRTRPTAYNLFWALKRMLEKAKTLHGEINDIVQGLVEEAKEIADEDFRACLSIGEAGSRLLRNGDVVLTHCK